MNKIYVIIAILSILIIFLVLVLRRHYFWRVSFMRLFFKKTLPKKRSDLLSVNNQIIKITNLKYSSVLGNDDFDFYSTATTTNTATNINCDNVNLNNSDIYMNCAEENTNLAEENTNKPLLIWIHGGGYISGDKAIIGEWASELALLCDIKVACINYAHSPKRHYPSAVIQTGEALEYLLKNSHKFGIDANKIFLAGDSAGAQIAAQYASLVCNTKLQDVMNIHPKINSNQLCGVGLFCGFYNLDTAIKTKFLGLKTFLWAYTDCKNIKNYARRHEPNIIKNLTCDFPATFITCGNRDKLHSESVALADALQANGTPIDAFLQFPDHTRLGHEYQFAPLTSAYSAQSLSLFSTFVVQCRCGGAHPMSSGYSGAVAV